MYRVRVDAPGEFIEIVTVADDVVSSTDGPRLKFAIGASYPAFREFAKDEGWRGVKLAMLADNSPVEPTARGTAIKAATRDMARDQAAIVAQSIRLRDYNSRESARRTQTLADYPLVAGFTDAIRNVDLAPIRHGYSDYDYAPIVATYRLREHPPEARRVAVAAFDAALEAASAALIDDLYYLVPGAELPTANKFARFVSG